MIRIVLQINEEIVESLWMKRSMASVDPTFNTILFSLRSVERFQKFSHPTSRVLSLLEVKFLRVDDFSHRY